MAKNNGDSCSDRLVEFAQMIEKNVETSDHPSQSLDELGRVEPTERLELERFEGAMEYLRSIRGDIKKRSVAGSQNKTAGSTWFDQQETIPFDGILQSIQDEYPKRIGRFEIREVLGQGGFAVVFLARDPQLDRLVALKIPKPAMLMSPEAQTRFDREARAAAILSHPNIVPVFESGSVGPIHYIASGYCQGETLATWFESSNKSIPPARAARIVATLADAVQHAHQRGVIHRDLKPANILIEARDPQVLDFEQLVSTLRITDFGLAKLEASDDQTLTTEGAIIGTPAYMSPEQADGEKQIGLAADIYSLGVVLYELLTGELPHLGKSHIETLRRVADDLPARPGKYNQAVPRELDAICLKCLNKNPEQRYHSSFQLMQDLQNWLDGRPIIAKQASSLQKLKLWYARNRKLAAALAFAVGSLALGLSLTTWKWRAANTHLQVATVEQERSKRSLNLAQDMVDELVNRVVSDPSIDVEKREQFSRQSVELEEQLLRIAANDERVLMATASAHSHLGNLLFHDLAKVDEARLEFARARELLMQLPKESEFRQDRLEYLDGIEARIEASANLLNRKSVESYSEEPKSQAQWIVRAQKQHAAGNALRLAGSFEESLVKYQHGLDSLENTSDENPFAGDVKGRLFRASAISNLELARYDQSQQEVAEALQIFVAMSKEFGAHSDIQEHLALCFLARGKVNQKIQDLDQAIRDFRKTKTLYDSLRANDKRNVRIFKQLLFTHGRLASSLRSNGKSELAMEELQTSIATVAAVEPELLRSQSVLVHAIENGFQLFDLYSKSGNKTDSQKIFAQVTRYIGLLSELDPECEEADYFRRRHRKISKAGSG